MATLIVKDGNWYAHDMLQRNGIYRPQEAVFALGFIMGGFQESTPLWVADPKQLGRLEGVSNNVATFRAPLEPGRRAQLERFLIFLNGMKDRPEAAEFPDYEQRLEALRKQIAHGRLLEISLDTGIITRMHTASGFRGTSTFEWLDKAPGSAVFRTDDRKWTDHRGSLTTGDLNRLAFFHHCPVYDPKAKTRWEDKHQLVLTDLSTGRVRRPPIEAIELVHATFRKDRRLAIVSYRRQLEGMGLMEVNLSTGAQRTLWSIRPSATLPTSWAVSPEDRWLAITCADVTDPTSGGELMVVDLKSLKAKSIISGRSTMHCGWLNKDELLFEDRDIKKDNETGFRTTEWIARASLDGKVTRIRRGGSPVFLVHLKRILYNTSLKPGQGEWQTCKLDGSDMQRFGDGYQSCRHMSLGPDGKTLLSVRSPTGETPQPILIDAKTHKVKDIDLGAGLWLHAKW